MNELETLYLVNMLSLITDNDDYNELLSDALSPHKNVNWWDYSLSAEDGTTATFTFEATVGDGFSMYWTTKKITFPISALESKKSAKAWIEEQIERESENIKKNQRIDKETRIEGLRRKLNHLTQQINATIKEIEELERELEDAK